MLKVHVISGGIGAGKSSILHAIKACTQYDSQCVIFQEDVSNWQYYLERFYSNPELYAFRFQKEVEGHIHHITRTLEQIADKAREEGKVISAFVERSPVDVMRVFLPLNQKNLCEEDYACLMRSIKNYSDLDVWKNAKYFFIDCPLDVCTQRIITRGRGGEQYISEEYLANVLRLYEDMATEFDATRVENGRDNSLIEAMRVITHNL